MSQDLTNQINDNLREMMRHGYKPVKAIQMLSRYGAVEAAKRIIRLPDDSAGWVWLWMNDRVHLSFEAVVIDPRFETYFSEDDRNIARKSIELVGGL